MQQLLVVPGPLPGMNEFAGKKSRWVYTELKRKWGHEVDVAIKECAVKPFPYALLTCLWYEPNTRRDPDNITVGLKFVLDALVHRKILPGDGFQHILAINHLFAVDKARPRLELTMRTGCD